MSDDDRDNYAVNSEKQRLIDTIQSRLQDRLIMLKAMGLDDSAVERVTNPTRSYLLGLRDEVLAHRRPHHD